MQSSMEVPEEIKGLNWGAFLLSGIWAIFNQVWIGLLAFVPCISIFVMIYLLIKGNELAWNGPRQWESVDQFKAVQAAWLKWGLIALAVSIVLNLLYFFVIAAMIGTAAVSQPQ
jgi:hypothetical protein